MVCALSKSTTKGLSISALASSALALLLGILAVVARKKGTNVPKALLGFLGLFYLATVALILASGFAIYGRSVAKCDVAKCDVTTSDTNFLSTEDKKKKEKFLQLQPSNHDDNEDSTAHIIYTCVALVLFFALAITICSRSDDGCFLFVFFMLLSN